MFDIELRSCYACDAQIFNMLNARKIKDEINIFSGIFSSYMYLSVFAIIVLLQVRFHCYIALLFCAYFSKIFVRLCCHVPIQAGPCQ